MHWLYFGTIYIDLQLNNRFVLREMQINISLQLEIPYFQGTTRELSSGFILCDYYRFVFLSLSWPNENKIGRSRWARPEFRQRDQIAGRATFFQQCTNAMNLTVSRKPMPESKNECSCTHNHRYNLLHYNCAQTRQSATKQIGFCYRDIYFLSQRCIFCNIIYILVL